MTDQDALDAYAAAKDCESRDCAPRPALTASEDLQLRLVLADYRRNFPRATLYLHTSALRVAVTENRNLAWPLGVVWERAIRPDEDPAALKLAVGAVLLHNAARLPGEVTVPAPKAILPTEGAGE